MGEKMMKDRISVMVDRFLGWKLPKTFAPDCGISFNPTELQKTGVHPWPIGTNLLTAEEARAMLEHVTAIDREITPGIEALRASINIADTLREVLKHMESFTDEMTVGERYTNAGQAALDSLHPLRDAIAALGKAEDCYETFSEKKPT